MFSVFLFSKGITLTGFHCSYRCCSGFDLDKREIGQFYKVVLRFRNWNLVGRSVYLFRCYFFAFGHFHFTVHLQLSSG